MAEEQTDQDLVAVCDHCLNPIADGDGVLEVDLTAADRAAPATEACPRRPWPTS